MSQESVSNEDLTVDAIPPPDASWETIQRFALTFDGYDYWRSFGRCAEIANHRDPRSLAEWRTCLFFEQRRWRHFGEEPDGDALAYIRSLLEGIRTKVLRGEVQ